MTRIRSRNVRAHENNQLVFSSILHRFWRGRFWPLFYGLKSTSQFLNGSKRNQISIINVEFRNWMGEKSGAVDLKNKSPKMGSRKIPARAKDDGMRRRKRKSATHSKSVAGWEWKMIRGIVHHLHAGRCTQPGESKFLKGVKLKPIEKMSF